jgi:endogenous inhibitor of DNA gyrase (YacG/DUF329 family)
MAKGFCAAHYQRRRRHGPLSLTEPVQSPKGRKNFPLQQQECLRCRRMFEPTRSDHKYCNLPGCDRRKSTPGNAYLVTTDEAQAKRFRLELLRCGFESRPPQANLEERQFSAWRIGGAYKFRWVEGDRPRLARHCRRCRRSFWPGERGKHRRYCSRRCYRLEHLERNYAGSEHNPWFEGYEDEATLSSRIAHLRRFDFEECEKHTAISTQHRHFAVWAVDDWFVLRIVDEEGVLTSRKM